jgi:Domain of unknown function DUF11
VTGYRTRRLAAVVSSALLAMLLLGTSGVTAGTPAGWSIVATPLPSTVAPGKIAGYQVVIGNVGPSNISQLFMVDDQPGTQAYVNTPLGSCSTSGPLVCNFGALNAGVTITVIVAYTTPTTTPLDTFSVTFELNTTGGTFTRTTGSHGTVLPSTATTALDSSPNFAGGFSLTDATVGTTGTLGTGNHQTSAVTPPTGSAAIIVTIEDGLTSNPGGGGNICLTLRCIGDWTDVHVGFGHTGPIKVTLVLYGGSLPSGVSTNKIGLWHDGSVPNPVVLRCSDPTSIPSGGTQECVTVTKVGTNFQIVAWLLHNSGLHATY